MTAATHLTVRLVRFDRVREWSEIAAAPIGDSLRTLIAADTGAVGALAGSGTADVWAAVGLFADEPSARAGFDAGEAAIPWATDAVEVWTGLCQPYSHRGEVDFLGSTEPGGTFVAGDPPADGESFAVLTSVGWNFGAPDFDLGRAIDFGEGVTEVRGSMSGTDGMHSQQAFTVPGFAADGFTLTFWRDDAAMRAFAYRPGVHKAQMDRYKEIHNADRTSFTRLRVLEQSGTWFGTDPLDW
jgi:hypothetical protein